MWRSDLRESQGENSAALPARPEREEGSAGKVCCVCQDLWLNIGTSRLS